MPDIGIAAPPRVLTFLDRSGHVSFAWDAVNDDWVLRLIETKMRQGFQFWIVTRAARADRETRLERVQDIGPTRRVLIHDEDAKRLFDEGRIGLHVEPAGENEYVFERRARTPAEAAANETVAHRPAAGG